MQPQETDRHLRDQIAQEFSKTWRLDTPIFDCCKRNVPAMLVALNMDEARNKNVTELVGEAKEAYAAAYNQPLTKSCCMSHLVDAIADLKMHMAEAKEMAQA